MRPPPPVSATLWRERYESLRQHVLERRPILGSDPLGLVLLFTRGLAGWMQSWWEAPAAPFRTGALPPSRGGAATPQWQGQLISVLAHMAAQHLEPTRPDEC